MIDCKETRILGRHFFKVRRLYLTAFPKVERHSADTFGKFGGPVSTLLKKIAGLEIEQILPLHGPVLSGDRLAEAVRKAAPRYQLRTSAAKIMLRL